MSIIDTAVRSEVEDPIVTINAGQSSATETASIEISCPTPGTELYYTTDLSDPSPTSPRYERAIEVAIHALPITLKVRAVLDGERRSRVVARVIEAQ